MEPALDLCSDCYNRPRAPERQDGRCRECGEWSDYWDSLDEEGRRRELEMMIAYSSEPQD